jgi:tripartite-type tricarboxylate transporter receptor subunit TctC
MMKKILFSLAAGLMLGHTFVSNAAAEYPEKPITMVVVYGAGGSGDTTIRAIADYAQRTTGATVVVENRAGGGGTIGVSHLSRAAPDGYTLGLVSTSPFTVTPYFKSVTYDPLTEFTYLGQYTVSPAPVIVLADSPFKTMEDLVAFGQANTGKLRWATGSPRGTNHIATEAALRQNNIQGQFVPFKGGAKAMTALLAGDIEFAVVTDFGPALKNKQVRLLAESGPNKIKGLPDVRTYKELGYDLTLPIFLGVGAPAGIPDEAVKFWEKILLDISTDPGFADVLSNYLTPQSYLDSKSFTDRIHTGYVNTGKTLKELGLLDE